MALIEARKVGDAEEQRSYQNKFERLRPAVEYFGMRLAKNEISDARTKADMMANVLIQAGLEFHTLIDIFEEDRAQPKRPNKKLKSIKKKLLQILKPIYQAHSVPELTELEFVDYVVGYLHSTVFSAAPQTSHSKLEKVRQSPIADLESARRRLEAATFERYNSFDGGMAQFRENLATLVPLKFYLVDNWLDGEAVDAATRRKAADFVQNLLAFHDQVSVVPSVTSISVSVLKSESATVELSQLLSTHKNVLFR